MNVEAKLQSLRHVDFVRSVIKEQQGILKVNAIPKFIPWRAVWNGKSVGIPCRIIFDASQPTSSRISLYDILPKGKTIDCLGNKPGIKHWKKLIKFF